MKTGPPVSLFDFGFGLIGLATLYLLLGLGLVVRFRSLTDAQMAILISHRFSTVRMADEIVVLDEGHVVERGEHDSLMAADGQYAHLFSLQAAGYR